MAAPAADNNPADRCAAAPAGFTGSAVGAQTRLKISGTPFNIRIIPETRALQINRTLKDPANRADEEAAGRPCDFAGLGLGMDSRLKKRFIRINIAQARQRVLVQQQAFHGAAPAFKHMVELLFGHFKRVRTERAEKFFNLFSRTTAKHAEPPRVPITELLPAIIQNHEHVCVRQSWRP